MNDSSVASAFGAAGSLVVLLLWLYYTSLIVFIGAEMTQVMARRQGHGLAPKAHGEMDLTAKGPKVQMKGEAED